MASDTTWTQVRVEEYKRRLANDRPYYSSQLIEAYGNLSYYQIMAGDFKTAIQSAKEGLNNSLKRHAPTADRDWINTNLALAYLLNGDFKLAEPLYRFWKDRIYTTNGAGQPYSVSFISDLDEVERQKIIPVERQEDVKKIRTLLMTPRPAAAALPRKVASANPR